MRLGILASGRGWHVEDLERAASEIGVALERLDFTRLRASLSAPADRLVSEPLRQEFFAEGRRMDKLDAVLVRTMPRGSLEQVIFRMDWLGRLEASGVPVVNGPRALEAAIDKYLSSARLEAAGLPVPTTVACESLPEALKALEMFGDNAVIKPLFGSEGRGVERLQDNPAGRERLAQVTDEDGIVYLQRFVPHPGYDYRVFTIAAEPVACLRRVAHDDWRTNVAQGGRAERVDLPAECLQLAADAAKALDVEIAGVDLLPDLDGKPWILEVNAVPGWRALADVSGVDVARHVLEYVQEKARAVTS